VIKFIDTGENHVVGIRIDGEIIDQEFDAVAALLEKRMSEFPKVNVYVELMSFEGMELKTFLKDLRFGIENINRIDKEAVVTEKDWVQKITSAADNVTGKIELKAFSFDEKEKAMKWVQE